MGDQAKKVINEHGKVETLQLLELKDNVQCTHCHRCLTSGHVFCQCGRIITFDGPVFVIEGQIRRCVEQQL